MFVTSANVAHARGRLERGERMARECLAERSNALEGHTTDRILDEFEIGTADVVVVIVPALGQRDVAGHHVEAESPERSRGSIPDRVRPSTGAPTGPPSTQSPRTVAATDCSSVRRAASTPLTGDPLRPPRKPSDAIEEASAVDEHLTPRELQGRREVGRVRVDRHGVGSCCRTMSWRPGVVEREMDRTQQSERVPVAAGERPVLECVGELTVGFRVGGRVRAARGRARGLRRAAPAAPRERASAVRTSPRRVARGTDLARTPGAGAASASSRPLRLRAVRTLTRSTTVISRSSSTSSSGSSRNASASR